MLEQIANLVGQHGQEAVVNNPDIPASSSKDILAEATHTITGGLQNMLAGGGLQDILSMFTGASHPGNEGGGISGLVKSPVISMMIGHFIDKLVSKFNFSPEKASQVSNKLIPNVMTDLVNRTRDTSPANDSFDLDDLIGSLTGGNSSTKSVSGNDGTGFNFQELLNQFTGNSKSVSSGNSGFDLQDIISEVTSKAQQSKAAGSGSGGLMDLIKSFMPN